MGNIPKEQFFTASLNQTCTCFNEKVNTTDDYFQSDPLTSIADSTAPLSDLIFPGVTICNINQVYINQIINQQSIHQSNHQSNGYTSNHQLSINQVYIKSSIINQHDLMIIMYTGVRISNIIQIIYAFLLIFV